MDLAIQVYFFFRLWFDFLKKYEIFEIHGHSATVLKTDIDVRTLPIDRRNKETTKKDPTRIENEDDPFSDSCSGGGIRFDFSNKNVESRKVIC